jgi:hypothetical protein
MARQDIDVWAKQFADDLGRGEVRIPFERAVQLHLATIKRLLDHDRVPFPVLVRALARADAVRDDGRPFSPNQLSTAVRRAVRAVPLVSRVAATALTTSSGSDHSTPERKTGRRRPTKDATRSKQASSQIDAIQPQPPSSLTKSAAVGPPIVPPIQDLTDADINAALRRLRK